MNENQNATSGWLAEAVAIAERVGAQTLTLCVPLPALLSAVADTSARTSVSYLADGRLIAQAIPHIDGLYVAVSAYVAGVDGREVPPRAEQGWAGLRLAAADAPLLVALPGGDR